MKRLIRKSTHNYDTRDEALLYIDGNIMIGNNHPDMINEYLKEYHSGVLDNIVDEFQETNQNINGEEADWESVMQFSEYERSNGNIKSIDNIGLAFGHIVYDEVNNETDEEYDQAVYLETNSITNVTLDEVVTAIKSELGDIPIFDDDSYSSLGGFADRYVKISKLTKMSQYVHCHNCGWDNNDFLLNDDGTKNGWSEGMQDRKFKRLYKEQKYHSLKEFKEKNPNGICPECGSKELDID